MYGQSIVHPDGPWSDFAATTVQDWLDLLEAAAPPAGADSFSSSTAVLAVLRNCLLDLLATGDVERTTAAVETTLAALRARSTAGRSSTSAKEALRFERMSAGGRRDPWGRCGHAGRAVTAVPTLLCDAFLTVVSPPATDPPQDQAEPPVQDDLFTLAT